MSEFSEYQVGFLMYTAGVVSDTRAGQDFICRVCNEYRIRMGNITSFKISPQFGDDGTFEMITKIENQGTIELTAVYNKQLDNFHIIYRKVIP